MYQFTVIMRRIKEFLLSREVNRNVLTLMTGSAAAQGLTFCAIPVLTRLYSPGDFGVFALYMSVVSIVSVFCSGRYELSLPLPETIEEANNLLVFALLLILCICLLTVPVFISHADMWSPVVKQRTVEKFFFFIPFGLFGQSAYCVMTFWFLRKKAFKIESQSRILVAVCCALVSLLLGALQEGDDDKTGLMLGHIYGQIAGVLFLGLNIVKIDFRLSDISLAGMKRLALRYKKFPLLSVWDVVLNRLSFHIPVWILTRYQTIVMAAFFTMARNVYAVPTSFIQGSVAKVFFNKISEAKKGAGDVLRIMQVTFFSTLLLSLIPFALIAFCMPFLFGMMFGAEWAAAGKYVLYLLPLAWARFAIVPVSTLLIVYELQGLNLLWQIGLTGLTFVFYYLLRGLPVACLVGISSLLLAGWYVVLLAAVFKLARKYRISLAGRDGITGTVCHISTVHPASDIRIFHKECKTLHAAGLKVTLVTPHEQAECVEGVHIRALPRPVGRPRRMVFATWAALVAAVRENAGLYHVHDAELIPVAAVLKFLGKKVVYDAHEDLRLAVLNRRWLPHWARASAALLVAIAEAAAGRFCDGIVAATPAIAKRFPGSKTVVIRNYPIVCEFDDVLENSYAKRPMLAAYVGGITEVRGIREMLQATELIPERFNARLALAGVFQPPQFEHDITVLPGWARVDFYGWVSRTEIAALMGRARIGLVVLHPVLNHIEAQPNKLFEYMAAGVPVIASDFPQWRALIETVRCGIAVDHADTRAIADAMIWLFEHPEEAEAMGRRGREAVTAQYNWRREAVKLVAFYERLGQPLQAGPAELEMPPALLDCAHELLAP